jgi:ribose 1,5-bisphosphokinase PhnN
LILHRGRENREKLIKYLTDMMDLRDTQTNVQMMLNQNDFAKALEMIATVQRRLAADFSGVVCFRYDHFE